MPDKKITELTAATLPLAGTEALEIVQGGVNVQAPASAFGGTPADATPTTKGIAKLYTVTGSNTDGSMDQNSITTALGLKTAAFVETGIVYVDPAGNNSTGVLGRADLPFQTIDAALDAGVAVTYLHVKLSMGTFAKPTAAKISRSNLWLHGSGKPGYNWVVTQTSAVGAFTVTDPTALIGGTIIQGGLAYTVAGGGNLHVWDLGVDCGSAYVTGGGTETDCIYIVGNSPPAPFALTTNVVIHNVTTLGRTASSAFHGIVCIGQFATVIHNVDTYFATHGIAIKSIRAFISDVRCYHHTLDGIILKSDPSVSTGGELSNFQIYGAGGLYLETFAGSVAGVYDWCISGGFIRETTYGVKVAGAGTINQNCYFTDVYVRSCTGIGFDIDNSASFILNNCRAVIATTGFRVRTVAAEVFTTLNDCFAAGCTDGFDVAGDATAIIYLNCCMARGNTGTGFVLGVGVQSNGLVSIDNSAVSTGESTKISLERRTSFNRTGAAAPTATVYISGGAAAPNSAPLKLGSGTVLTTPEAGAVEFDATNWFVTSSTTRYTLPKTLTATAVLDFGSTAAGAIADLTVAMPGAVSGDIVMLGVPTGSVPDHGTFFAWVSAANVVTVRFANNDLTVAKDPASGTFRVAIIKY